MVCAAVAAQAGGEEVTIAYGTSLLWLPPAMRRTQLARVWGFLCKCARCVVDMERARADRERGAGVRIRQDLGRYCRHVIDMRFEPSYLKLNGIL